MTVVRVPLCRNRDCPRPRDPDYHQCFCGKLAVHHHHVTRKGMGGRRGGVVVCLCPTHHEGVHSKLYTDALEGKHYVIRNRKGQAIVRTELPS